jgi:hypothetical protein
MCDSRPTAPVTWQSSSPAVHGGHGLGRAKAAPVSADTADTADERRSASARKARPAGLSGT